MARMTDPSPVGLVAGSGVELEPLLDRVTRSRDFSEVPGLCKTAVAGHIGRIVEGYCGAAPIVLQSGRLHLYEGHPCEQVARSVDVMQRLGVGTVLFTNAAGALAEDMDPGDLMAVSGISLYPFGCWPDRPDRLEIDFELDRCDRRGTYVWVHGPCYETKAEVAALRALEGDAVGMSTAPEVARCHELGLRAGAISCITNRCGSQAVLRHEDVVETARSASVKLCHVIRGWLRGLR